MIKFLCIVNPKSNDMTHFLFSVLLVCSVGASADEGMWMLNRIDQKTADVMKNLGSQLTPPH